MIRWLDFAAEDLRLVVTDGGCYGCGFYCKLPSGWCFLEIAIHYGDRR